MKRPEFNISIPVEQKLKKRLYLIIENKKKIVTYTLAGIVIGLLFSLVLPKKYSAIAQLFFKYNSVNNTLLSSNGKLDNENAYLSSDEFQNKTVKELNKLGTNVTQADINNASEIIVNNTNASIEIKITSNEPEKTANIANAVSQKFSEKCYLNGRAAYLNVLKSIGDREKDLNESIRRDLADQQNRTLTNLNIQQEQMITQIAEFESELESIELDNIFYSGRVEELNKIFEKDFPEISSQIYVLNNSALNEMRLSWERIETKKYFTLLSQKLGNFPITYPWGDNYQLSNLEKTKSDFSKEIENYANKIGDANNVNNIDFFLELSKVYWDNQIMVNAIDYSKNIIFNIMTDLENRFNLIPFELIDNARQNRTKKFNNALSIKLKTKTAKLKENEKAFFPEIDSIKNAEVPDNYYSPNTSLNIFLGGLLGLIISLFLALTSNSTQIDLIKSPEDLEEIGFKIVSIVPSVPIGSPLLFDALNQSEQKLLDPKIIDSFKNIETFLKYGSLEKKLKTILVTSGQEGEGKSLIASNVAISLANSDNKVLLVDADLIQPQLHKYFRVKSTPSLAHYLFRKKELNEIIRETHNSNLDLITCIEFPQNPSVIITSERMKNFMKTVEKDYDYIVYDTCSLCKLKETAELAVDVDEVILVVRSNKTKLSEVLAAQSILNENNVSNFNIVVNDVAS